MSQVLLSPPRCSRDALHGWAFCSTMRSFILRYLTLGGFLVSIASPSPMITQAARRASSMWGRTALHGAFVAGPSALFGCSSRPRSLLALQSSLDGHKERVYTVHDGYNDPFSNTTRALHNKKQASVFDETAGFFASEDATPEEVWPRLRTIVRAAKLTPASRVLDVGTGCGVLIRVMQKDAGVAEENVLGVDLAPAMVEQSRLRYPKAEFWVGDIVDLPQHLAATERGANASGGYFDAAFCNAMFGNVFDQKATLMHLGDMLTKGGRVVISHPLGAAFVDELRARSPTVVLHDLPKTRPALDRLALHTHLKVESFSSEPSLYVAVLKREAHRPLQQALYFRGQVAPGYGRGSKKLGIPTANLPESLFQHALTNVPTGVYLGWASVGQGKKAHYKAVVNVGYSPTFVGEENREKIIEAHIIDGDFDGDFYGQEMRLLLLGFQRPELRFPSFPALVAAINQDVLDAKEALDSPLYNQARFLQVVQGKQRDDGETFQIMPFSEDM